MNGNIYTTVNSIKILKTFNKLTNGRDEDLYNGKTIGKILKYTYNTITELLQNPNIVSSGMSLDSIAYEVSKKFPVSNSQTGNTIKDCIYNIFSSKAGEFSKLTIHNNDIEQGNNKIVELLASCVGMTREQVSQYMDKIPELEQQNVMTRQSENTSTTTNNN